MQEDVRKLIEEVFKQKPIKIEEITAERGRDDGSSFLIELKGKKIKAIVLNERDELQNFLKYVPKIKHAPKIICHKRNIILVDWLNGEMLSEKDLTKKDLSDIAKLQAEIHKTQINFNKEKIIRKNKQKFNDFLKYLKKNNLLTKKDIKNIEEKFMRFFSKKL